MLWILNSAIITNNKCTGEGIVDIVLRIEDIFFVKERGKIYSVVSETEEEVIRIGEILSDSQGNKFKITGAHSSGYRERRYEISLENMDGIEVQGSLLTAGSQSSHKRRVRYSGTYPRKFSEKYKELNPEKYADTVEKVMKKGSTPAGMHISIMVKEILDFLEIKPGQQGLDATLGYGGHTRRMLECLQGEGHLYGLDVDPIESEKTKKRLADEGYAEDILTVKLMNFADIDHLADEVGKFDFVLADLGVSSMQIDNPERGFSYKAEGPLDLRLNPEKGISASERLLHITRDELAGMLEENADEPYAEEIADLLVSEIRKGNKIDTTTKLAGIVEKALWSLVPKEQRREAVKKSCARVFQALRIDVNSEFEVLDSFLEKLPSVLNPGGRAAILTFHSGEDRLVKKSFKRHKKSGEYSEIADEVIRPSKEECIRNSRAHSTKMRWAVKADC